MGNFEFKRVSDIAEAGKGLLEVDHSAYSSDPRLKDMRLVILALHDADGSHLPPEFFRIFQDVRDDLDEYLRIERDVGSGELAQAIMEQVRGALYVRVCLPRGVVDFGRNDAHSLPLALPAGNDTVVQTLRDSYRHGMAIVRGALKAATGTGTVLDVHTMCPGDPFGSAPPTTKDSLRQRNDHWKRAATQGKARPFDIIYATEETGETVGDKVLAEEIGKICKRLGIWYDYNKPYGQSKERMSIDLTWGNRSSGVSLDPPKSLVTSWPGEGEGEPFDLVRCSPDMTKIERLAHPIAAMLDHYVDWWEVMQRELKTS